MRITWKWVIAVPIMIITGPAWYRLVTQPFTFLEDNSALRFGVGALVICGIAALLSLIVNALANNPLLKIRIFFFGQLAAAVFVIGLFAYLNISRKIYEATQENIDDNKWLVEFTYDDAVVERRALRALDELGARYANKNDIRLLSVNTESVDTVINDCRETARILYFEYTDKNRPGEKLYSKYWFGECGHAMFFYDVAENALPELKRKNEEEARRVSETLKEATEATTHPHTPSPCQTHFSQTDTAE